MPYEATKFPNQMKQLIIRRLDTKSSTTAYIGTEREAITNLRSIEYALPLIGYKKDLKTLIWTGPNQEKLLLEIRTYKTF